MWVLFIASASWAQTYTSVPVDDPVYDFIDDMILKGVIRRDVMVRPWPRSKVLSILHSIQDRNVPISVTDREYLTFLVERLDKAVDKSLLEEGAVDVPSDIFPAEIGVGWRIKRALGFQTIFPSVI